MGRGRQTAATHAGFALAPLALVVPASACAAHHVSVSDLSELVGPAQVADLAVVADTSVAAAAGSLAVEEDTARAAAVRVAVGRAAEADTDRDYHAVAVVAHTRRRVVCSVVGSARATPCALERMLEFGR